MIGNAILEGLVYSVVLGAIVTISQLFNARLWINDYPKAIQNIVPKRTKKEIIEKLSIGIPFILIMFGYPIYSTIVLKETMSTDYTFMAGFLNTFIICSTFNVFDLVVLDWLIFCYINPKYLVLEGTEGLKEYKDYGFHLRAAFKGFLFTVIISGITAVLTII